MEQLPVAGRRALVFDIYVIPARARARLGCPFEGEDNAVTTFYSPGSHCSLLLS